MNVVDQPIDRPGRRLFLRAAADAAVLVLLFGTMFSAWALVISTGVLLAGLAVYAVLSNDPGRHALVLLALGAAVASAVIAALVAR